MKALPSLVRAAILLAPAVAATAGELPAAANPGAAVPATRYQGALPYRAAPAPAASPDQAWRAANRTVGAYDSMMLTMEMPEPAPAPSAAAAPASQPAAPGTGEPMHHHEASQ